MPTDISTILFRRGEITIEYAKQYARASSVMQPKKIHKRDTRHLLRAHRSISIRHPLCSIVIQNGWSITNWSWQHGMWRLCSASTASFTNQFHSEYCHNVTAVEPKWLVEVAPQFFKVADANKISKRKRQEKIEPLFNKVCIGDLAFLPLLCTNMISIVRESRWMAIIESQAECSFSKYIFNQHHFWVSDASSQSQTFGWESYSHYCRGCLHFVLCSDL